MIQLFGSLTSPFVRHCRIALIETEIEFELIDTNYTQSAAGSPAQRVPWLVDGPMQLHDSASILKYIREKADEQFCADIRSFNLFCLVNTALDTTINLFLLERSGIDLNSSDYLLRQANRIQSCLQLLEQKAVNGLRWDDAGIRLACFIEWAQYRQRLQFKDYPNLAAWLAQAQHQQAFHATTPPAL